MKVLVLILLVGGLMLSSCGGSSSKNNANVKEVNPADTIYLGDLREKFANDSVFFKIVAPDLMLMDYQYLWAVTESEAVEKGLTKEYYKRVKKEITDTNESCCQRSCGCIPLLQLYARYSASVQTFWP